MPAPSAASSGLAGVGCVVTVNGAGFLESGMWLRVGADAVASAYNVNARGESAMCVLDAGQMVGRHNIYMF